MTKEKSENGWWFFLGVLFPLNLQYNNAQNILVVHINKTSLYMDSGV